ncbi:cobaltochelatase subunit CobN [uncultured Aquimarina sp.]|uniref:cobaltochelatase subunit CobN n=1 Tax=uncultured Aquimarina sp. TaxID=575652 RepID=UPI002629D996|nr:cobaltochelatase subunit CobN [uncultured Aquimarina sp.]
MHLISTIPGGWNPNDEGVFYIQQKPGDILFLSAADTELYTLNKVYSVLYQENLEIPSLRLANLTYFKQELTIDTYIEEVVSKAKIVVLKLLGGTAYFSYLCEAIKAYAEAHDIQLLFLPGDNVPDLELMQLSTVSLEKVDLIWNYFTAGGKENSAEGLKLIMNLIVNNSFTIKERIYIPDLFLYHSSQGRIKSPLEIKNKPLALIIAYRSSFLADNMAPVDCLIKKLEDQGVLGVSIMALSYRNKAIKNQIVELLERFQLPQVTVIVNTTGFSIQSFNNTDEKGLFHVLNVPVIQAIMASCNKQTWEDGDFGLPPTDIAMNIALPEVDGKIITTAVSFKEAKEKDELTDSEIVYYAPNELGCEFVVKHAKAWITLNEKANHKKNIALILPNYPSKNSRLANGVGLDTPASTIIILEALKLSGYDLGDHFPKSTEALMNMLTETITNELESLAYGAAEIKISESDFYKYYNTISPKLRETIEKQWGYPKQSPNYRNGFFLIPGKKLGNVFLSIQPNRGYNIDLQATYHSPDLPPTYAYLAYYIWVQQYFKANAIVHIGKHGNLEWLPGKSVALSSETCFPSAILGPVPHFYPFIINDPGEGTQAKRRNQAIVIDHLIPPMTRAENYGDLLKLELLIDEFYESALMDPKRANLIKKKIETLVNSTHLKSDLNTKDDDIDTLLEVIDGYLCELKEAQIRGGLHIFGKLPEGEKLRDLIVALHRLPQDDTMGITQALAKDLNLDFDPINISYEITSKKTIYGVECRTYGQIVEVLEHKAKNLVEGILTDPLNDKKVGEETRSVLNSIKKGTLSKLNDTKNEVYNLLSGLNGNYVPAGGSGAPTRGRLDILPTGRNFYSVDVRTIPSQSAYQLGVKSAKNLVDRYLQEEGDYPASIGLSVWGTSTMRTGGDDIAQAFALIGVRPIWQGANRRVKDFEVLSVLELKRPRIDVLLRISGFFRDAFPDVISLFNAAIEKIAHLAYESDTDNPIKARYEKEKNDWLHRGLEEQQAEERSLYRVFGSKPGAYGAGLQGLIDEKNWKTQADLAQVYINWSGYAYYGSKNEGKSAHETFKARLNDIDIVIQNQDNREHDLLDSDDYYQFQGGMTAAVTHQKGNAPVTYFGDHSRPENPKIKSLKEELHKVYRSRVINPKWISGMQDHGYKGAFEMAATMDYLFAYDATTNLIEDFMYEGITEAYLMDEKNKAFIAQHNKWALKDMSERMLEAIQRGLWQNPSNEIIDKLKALYLQFENVLE